jgi:hypothetical protein
MAAGHGEAGFELCLSGQDGTPPSGGADGHATKVHCVLCVAGSLADTSISAVAIAVAFKASPVAPKPVRTDACHTSVDHRSTSPRGPPQQA